MRISPATFLALGHTAGTKRRRALGRALDYIQELRRLDATRAGRSLLAVCDVALSRRWRIPAVSTFVLGTVCFLDLASTVWIVNARRAAEANPFMNLFLAHGVYVFVGAKLALSIAPLMILEWARRRRPLFVVMASTFAVTAYVLCYVLGVACANAGAGSMDYEVPPMLVFNPDGSYCHIHEERHVRWLHRQQPRPSPLHLVCPGPLGQVGPKTFHR